MLIDDSKLVEIYFDCDEFCKTFAYWQQIYGYRIGKPNNSRMSDSEIMTVLVCYHLSGKKCFKYFYQNQVVRHMGREFPSLLSYSRFVEVIPTVCHHLIAYVSGWRKGRESGLYFVDSTKLQVCHNRRIHSHKVFEGIAQRGKTSTGWFFGLKLHLVVNHGGEVVRFLLSSGNKSDMNLSLLERLTKGLTGKVWADRGYASWKAFRNMMDSGLKLIFKFKSNMKNALLELGEKRMSKKRGVVESVIDILKNICDIEHSRHRKPDNAFTHIIAGLAAYSFRERKPSITLGDARLLNK